MKNFSSHNAKSLLCIKNDFYRSYFERYCELQLQEDAGPNKRDITSHILETENIKHTANIYAKQNAIIAGCEEVKHLLKTHHIQVRFFCNDGEHIQKGQIVAELTGKIRTLHKLERLSVNLLQRMSGIATETAEIKKHVSKTTLICSTRKTYMGMIDKKAVVIGGGGTHRIGLWDAVLIKENHLRKRSIPECINLIYKSKSHFRFAEIEAKNTKEVHAILEAIENNRASKRKKIDWIIMLDNFSSTSIANMIKKIHQHDIQVELSGNITRHNIKKFAKYSPDIISCGSLTHSSTAIDFSWKL